MGERRDRLSANVVGFEARVIRANARFKLGQDERDDVFADILAGMSTSGDAALVDWMRRFNPQRG